ncbi:response regulator [Rhizobium sp. KVB221]|uniref:histidine kinase n=1 Tax=Rhizobium setariae TaxID=2801340 RepID=A0A937CL93_9HYPH|nr:PAS domain-containing sensor histidine kinase [Rhizobium setariae]MBL0371376.1 response regulator [Rhizobium setariae]
MTKLNEANNHLKPVVENSQRPGTVLRLVLLAVVLLATAAAFVWFRDQLENEIVLGILGVLAMAGIFFLVSAVIGFVEVMPQNRTDTVARAVLNSHPDGSLITDRKGRIVYANAAYGRLTGAEQVGPVSLEHLLSRNRESTEAVYRLTNGLMEGKSGYEEFRLPRPLGQSDNQGQPAWWYRLKARPLTIEEEPGGPFFIWQISDITAERGEQEKFFRELQNAIDYLDHAPAGFFSAGRKGEIFYVNATLADWLGIDLTKFEPGSMMIRDICAGEGLTRLETIHPEPGQKRTETLDLDFRKANGQSLPVRIVHRVSAAKDGAPGESRTIVLQRGREEQGAHDDSSAAMRFNRFFNNTPMAIASVDGSGRILRTNTQFMKLFSGVTGAGEAEGNFLFGIVPETERERLHAALAAAKDRKVDIEPVEARHPTEEGRYFRFYVNAVIDQSEEAPEEAAIVYAVETTQQKALESQMAQTQKMNAVGTLAGGIAHDFNNVLTAILLSSDHLLLQARQSDSSFADLMEIKRNANRAAVLVRQLLAFSRKQTLRPAVISLTDAIGDLRMLVTRMLSGTKVKLEVDYGRDLWPVKTDLSQFEQVMVNLSVNARDAMPDGGILTIRTRNLPAADAAELNFRGLPAEDFVLIDVVDTGTGIPPEIMDKIFEPFFTTKDIGKGTGLGLSMVYGIIKQSGGYVFPESEIGKGTTFHIFLPRHIVVETADSNGADNSGPTPAVGDAARTGQGTAPVAAAEELDLTGKSAVVLLVEDEEAVRRGGKRMLEARGYTVHEAGSGVEALEILEELDGKVDVVVSDVVMPEMDGPTLLGEIRKLYPDMKFVFVSGFAEDAFARNLPEGSKFGFLPKPFTLKQLATTVREMLDGIESKREGSE